MNDSAGMTNDEQIAHVLRGIKSAAMLRNMSGETLERIFNAGFVAAFHLGVLPPAPDSVKSYEQAEEERIKTIVDVAISDMVEKLERSGKL
jgi:hypothetical protein